MNKSLVCGALALTLVATAVMAQEGRRGGRGPGGGQGPGGGFGGMMGGMMGGRDLASLLRMEKVQEELELVEDQVTEVNAALAEARPQGRRGGPGAAGGRGERGAGGRGERGRGGPGGPGGFTPEDRERMMAEMRQRENELRTNVAEILLPHQMDRLDQLHLQARGIAALSEPEIQAKLEVTEEQNQQMASTREELETAMREQMREAFQGGAGDAEGRQQLMARINAMRTDVENKILGVLKDEQKKTFEEMKGEAFEFPPPQFGAGGRGGRGGEGRGGRGGEGRGGRRGI